MRDGAAVGSRTGGRPDGRAKRSIDRSIERRSPRERSMIFIRTRPRERRLARAPVSKSFRRSWNCPWMSPHTVTGEHTGCTLLSSTRTSLTYAHSASSSASSSGSHCLI
eukprot:31439-Pelagococcus_subviridis.AAC.30